MVFCWWVSFLIYTNSHVFITCSTDLSAYQDELISFVDVTETLSCGIEYIPGRIRHLCCTLSSWGYSQSRPVYIVCDLLGVFRASSTEPVAIVVRLT